MVINQKDALKLVFFLFRKMNVFIDLTGKFFSPDSRQPLKQFRRTEWFE